MTEPEPTWTPTWWANVTDLAGAIRGTDDPLTFVLGAGAARSSGAPPTEDVETALSGATTRIPAGDLRKRLHEVSDRDVRRALEPIFSRLHPHLGYRCLAALARQRRVLIINVNWDPLVTMACERLDVPWVAYDIGERALWAERDKLPGGRGLVDVHVHGRTSGRPRFGIAETPGFERDELEHLRDLHCGARRIYLGVSLDDDHDVVRLLRGLDEGAVGTVWAFFREAAPVDPAEISRRTGKLGATRPVFCQGEDVDADHILLALLDGTQDRRWNRLRAQNPQVRLPALEHLVLPEPDVLRQALDARVTVLVGDPQLGKTTAAWLLSSLQLAWSANPGAVRHFDGAAQANASLAVATGADPADRFIIENPFGEPPDHAPNPGFADDLARWATTPGAPKAIVTLRTADWEGAASGPRPVGEYVSSPVPGDWYSISDLRLFAGRSSSPGLRLVDEVAPEGLDTPGRVLDRAGGIAVAAIGAGPGRIEAVERERERLLDEHPALAAFCSLVRLQALLGEPVEVDVLRAVSKFSGTTQGSALMLFWYRLDDRPRVRLALPVDAAAADRWMIAHPAEVEALVEDAACPVLLREGWRTWRLLSAVRADDWSTVRASAPDALAEHSGDILAANGSAEALAIVSSVALGPWPTADLAYGLVRLWQALPPARKALLDRLVQDRAALGTYAVLEACLYLQGRAATEVWDEVRGHMWRLGDEAAVWEMALCVDGLAWRPAPHGDWSAQWIRDQLDRHDALLGVLPVLTAYHLSGAVGLGLKERIVSLRSAPQSAEQAALAAQLVAWHFVHQSRARAQLGHQRIVEKDYLCRTLHPPVGSDDEDVMWLLNVLRHSGEPGWAFHAACFLMGALGRQLGPLCRSAALQSLYAAPKGDIGVITAAATYEVAAAGQFGPAMRSYFSDEQNRSALLDALGQGVVVDGQEVSSPGFAFAGRPRSLLLGLGIRFGRLEQFLGRAADPVNISAAVRASARRHVSRGVLSTSAAARLVSLVESGDLRPLDDGLAAFHVAPNMDGLVLRAGALLETP